MSNDAHALYLPAVSKIYANAVGAELPEGRTFPQDLTLRDLAFWLDSSQFWQHHAALHSVGQYKVGAQPLNPLGMRGKSKFVLVGDSGGYQIGTGKLDGFNSLVAGMTSEQVLAKWTDSAHLRHWIVGWLETFTDYAMTIDMPLWVTAERGKNSPFHRCSPAELRAVTVDNLKFIDMFRQGKTRWLNVVQGHGHDEMVLWWDAVKWFPSDGYALAGSAGVAGGLENMLKALLTMRDDSAFDSSKKWLHVLGVSTPVWSVILTTIQAKLREYSPELRVSYDSATPFKMGGRYEKMATLPTFGTNLSDWLIGWKPSPQGDMFFGSDEPFGDVGFFGDKFKLGHLNVRAGKWDANPFDTISTLILTNYNVKALLDSFDRANALVSKTNRANVPRDLALCVDFIGHVFRASDWRGEIAKNSSLLAAVAA